VEKPQLNWTSAKWAFLAAWLPLTLAAGIVVVPSGMSGIRVSQTAGTRPGNQFPPEIQPGRRLRRDGTPGPVEGFLPLIHTEHTDDFCTKAATEHSFRAFLCTNRPILDQVFISAISGYTSFSPIANCGFFQSNEGYSHFL